MRKSENRRRKPTHRDVKGAYQADSKTYGPALRIIYLSDSGPESNSILLHSNAFQMAFMFKNAASSVYKQTHPASVLFLRGKQRNLFLNGQKRNLSIHEHQAQHFLREVYIYSRGGVN
jgi:hypothetical protein